MPFGIRLQDEVTETFAIAQIKAEEQAETEFFVCSEVSVTFTIGQ